MPGGYVIKVGQAGREQQDHDKHDHREDLASSSFSPPQTKSFNLPPPLWSGGRTRRLISSASFIPLFKNRGGFSKDEELPPSFPV